MVGDMTHACSAAPQRVLEQLADAAIEDPLPGHDRLGESGLLHAKFIGRVYRVRFQRQHPATLGLGFPLTACTDQRRICMLVEHVPADRLRGCVRHAFEELTDGGDLFVGTRDLLAVSARIR